MNSFLKSTWGLILCACLFACGGSGSGDGATLDLDGAPDGANANSSVAFENTLNGVGVDLQALEFKTPANQNKPQNLKFTISNQGQTNLTLTVSVVSSTGGFGLMNGNRLAGQMNFSIKGGEHKEVTLQFDARQMGAARGFVEVTAQGKNGHIVLPMSARVSSGADFKIISTQFLCSDNSQEVDLDTLDFFRVASGAEKKKTFKICNTGDAPLRITSTRILPMPEEGQNKSQAFNPPAFNAFDWHLEDLLDDSFNYYNPHVTEPYGESQKIDYDGPAPRTPEAYRVMALVNGNKRVPSGIVIASGSYALFEVTFTPTLNVEADDDTLFNPIDYSAQLLLNTSLGTQSMDLLAATGGEEPLLKIVTGDNTAPACSSESAFNLDADNASLYFGKAQVFKDWVLEDKKVVTLRFCNEGSGTKPLKVWLDQMTAGYFSFARQAPERTFPLIIEPGQSKTVKLVYLPTPPANIATNDYDFGQLVLHHNGGNLEQANKVTLLGSQEGAEAVQAIFNGTALKHTYRPNEDGVIKFQNFQCMRINTARMTDPTEVKIEVASHSTQYALKTRWHLENLSPHLQAEEMSGEDIASVETAEEISGGRPDNAVITLQLHTVGDVVPETVLKGKLVIENSFINAPPDIANRYGRSLNYSIPFKLRTTATGKCEGAGAPLDGTVTMIVDRITMNMPSLGDPARNPPAFKFHMLVDLDKAKGRARIHGLAYDPMDQEANDNPVKQIRSYAHQVTSVNSSLPLPTNPYKLEFEAGSWDGDFKECAPYEPAGQPWKAIANAACMANNGAQVGTLPTGEEVQVFYHEFVKLANCGSPAIEGKFATFFKKPEETIEEVFSRLPAEGSAEQYDNLRGAYQFDSYIIFHQDYNGTNCVHKASETPITDPNEIKNCWKSFAEGPNLPDGTGKDGTFFARARGMIEECAYFQFSIEDGKDCFNENISSKESWSGCGEYEVDPNDDSQYNLTLRNVHIQAFSLGNAQGTLFDQESKLLFSNIYVTLTTKAVKNTELIAVNTRKDFLPSEITVDNIGLLSDLWPKSGVNGKFTTSDKPGQGDNVPCVPGGRASHCRGNFEFVGNKIVHAGEPINLEQKNRMVLVGLSAFAGRGKLAPSYAREQGGKGKALYFTFHGCMKENEIDPEGKVVPLAATEGCYDGHIDDFSDVANPQAMKDQYLDPKHGGILKAEDFPAADADEAAVSSSKAYINFQIFPDDRNRMADYFNSPETIKASDPDLDNIESPYNTDTPYGYGN